MHHFAGPPSGAEGCVFFLVSFINHFPVWISGATGEGGEEGGGVPAVPPHSVAPDGTF